MLVTNVRGREYRIGFRHEVPVETQCFVRVGEELVAAGYASCAPCDNFSRVKGRKISMSRAMLNAGFTKEERSQVWQEYFKKQQKIVPGEA